MSSDQFANRLDCTLAEARADILAARAICNSDVQQQSLAHIVSEIRRLVRGELMMLRQAHARRCI